MRDINGDFEELSFRRGSSTENEAIRTIIQFIPVPGLKQVLNMTVDKALMWKAGTIWVDLEKRSIKREGVDFVSSVMNDLFNE